jgi:hypothetical protein
MGEAERLSREELESQRWPAMVSKTSLQSDFEVFEKHRKEWVEAHLGEFVVIRGGTVAGFYPDYESALRAGLQNFGIKSEFLVKQVSVEEPVFVIY